jgi:hypothetical protein
MAKNVELFCGALSQADPFEVAIFQLKIWFLIRDKKRERERRWGLVATNMERIRAT